MNIYLSTAIIALVFYKIGVELGFRKGYLRKKREYLEERLSLLRENNNILEQIVKGEKNEIN